MYRLRLSRRSSTQRAKTALYSDINNYYRYKSSRHNPPPLILPLSLLPQNNRRAIGLLLMVKIEPASRTLRDNPISAMRELFNLPFLPV